MKPFFHHTIEVNTKKGAEDTSCPPFLYEKYEKRGRKKA